MTDKLDLSEEIAVLRRTLAAQSIMLKEAMCEIEGLQKAVRQPHDRLKALDIHSNEHHLRLQILENWQFATSQATLPTAPQPSPPWTTSLLPDAGCFTPANDNEPCSAPLRHPPDEYSQQISDLQTQKRRLIVEIEDQIRRSKKGIVSGDIWELITALDTVLCRYRVDERA